MNDWGIEWDASPKFEYKGKGIYEATTELNKGNYEFKIAPMNWKFDLGAIPNSGKLSIGVETTVIKKPGSDNLKLELIKNSELTFRLDMSNEESITLTISK
jgi:pullulanase